MPALGYSRPGRVSSKSADVCDAVEAEVACSNRPTFRCAMARPAGLKGADTGLMHRNNEAPFKHLAGVLLQG
jgi:hypothetical protein